MKRLALMGHLYVIAAQVQLLYLLGASKSYCEVEGCGQIASKDAKKFSVRQHYEENINAKILCALQRYEENKDAIKLSVRQQYLYNKQAKQ